MKVSIAFSSLFALFILASCQQGTHSGTAGTGSDSSRTATASAPFPGNYVSDGYSQRGQGADWMAVMVEPAGDSMFHVKVRARIDRKKPSCRLDAVARMMDANTLRALVDEKPVLFAYKNGKLQIRTENQADSLVLGSCCSGGGTLAGEYSQADANFDSSQLDPRVFVKTLSYGPVSFEVSSTQVGAGQTIFIQPAGLHSDNKMVSAPLVGAVTDAEVSDLNADGNPEVLVFTRAAGSVPYGDVVAFTAKDGKTLTQVFLPNLMEDASLEKGYRGDDHFTVEGHSLLRSYPLYEGTPSGDFKKTSRMRQVRYSLAKGPMVKEFTVEKVTEMPAHP